VQQRPAAAYPLEVTGSLVPVSNGRYLAERLPGSELTILPASHIRVRERGGEPRDDGIGASERAGKYVSPAHTDPAI
jgi:hypothetical protein